MNYLQMAKEIFKKKNFKKLAPFIVGFVVAIGGIFGTNLDPQEIESIVMISGGLITVLIGLFVNPDKNESENKNEENKK